MSNPTSKLKRAVAAALLVGAVAWADTAFAQAATAPLPKAQEKAAATDFTDAEIKQFAAANNRLMAFQREGEKEMMNILKEEEVEVEKFNEFANAYQEQRLE